MRINDPKQQAYLLDKISNVDIVKLNNDMKKKYNKTIFELSNPNNINFFTSLNDFIDNFIGITNNPKFFMKQFHEVFINGQLSKLGTLMKVDEDEFHYFILFEHLYDPPIYARVILKNIPSYNTKNIDVENHFNRNHGVPFSIFEDKNLDRDFYIFDPTKKESLSIQFYDFMIDILRFDYYKYIWITFLDVINQPFPYPTLTDKQLHDQFNDLKKSNDNNLNSIRGIQIINHFHKSIYQSSYTDNLSPLEVWNDYNQILKTISNRFIYTNKPITASQVLHGFSINKIAPKVSIFSPGKMMTILDRYTNNNFKTVYDPFSGFSGRMLGSIARNFNYIGNDINPITVNEANNIINYFNITNAIVLNKDTLDTKVELPNDHVVITCPPYGYLEKWNQDIIVKESSEWIDIILSNIKAKKYIIVGDSRDNNHDKYWVDSIYNKGHFSSHEDETGKAGKNNKNFEKIFIINK